MNDPQQRTVNVGSSSGLAPSTQLIADFKAGMQRLAAAPCVLTTIHQGVRRGLTATAVCSLTADPPTLIACINESAEAFAAMEQAGRLCVNVLTAEQVDIARRFSGAMGHKGEARFEQAQWFELKTGAPALAGAMAVFDCSIVQRTRWSTHSAFICQVEAVQVGEVATPLLYANREFLRAGPLG